MKSSKTIYNILISSLILLTSTISLASWGLGAGTGSYMGQKHIFISYESQNSRHNTDFGYGFTKGELGSDIEQINFRYTYSPFKINFGKVSTNLLGAGILTNRWQSSEAFWESPDQYPETYYYGPTLRRAALVLTQKWNYENFQFYADWAVVDYVLIAIYNNESYRKDLQIWGGGVGLRYYF